jgi:DNA repair exonuclease SbcCD ATPase subunit
MLIFKKIRAKNFLSIGNNFFEYELDKDRLTLLRGRNSEGKSIVIDMLTFSLYKKAYRNVNLPQLVNNVNQKDCIVEIEFDTNGNEWKIRRGLSPNIFEIYKDGQLLDQQSSIIEQQKWLEQNVLKMSYKTFIQIVILGTAAYIPFMQLTPSDRRDVVEDLLDIKMFSFMNALIKEKIKEFKDAVKILTLKKDSLEDKVNMQKDFIEQLENRSKSDIDDKTELIKNLFSQIEELEDSKILITEQIEGLTQELDSLIFSSDQLKQLLEKKTTITIKAQGLTDSYNFFKEHDVCPTCSQDIDEEFKKNKQKETKKEIKELKSFYDELIVSIEEENQRQNSFKTLSEKIAELNKDINYNNYQISHKQKQIREYHSHIKKITDQLQNKNSEHEKLEKYSSELEGVKHDIIETKENIHYYDYVQTLLKDSGVKSLIVEKYLKIINQQINKYLNLLELYVNFSLDSEFNEKITTPTFETFSYGNFSEGQKRRVDLALLFTWRYITAVKNSASTNLLICDEILDGSLDEMGHFAFLKIIREEMKDSNVFVISHRDGIEHKFDNVISIEKRGHFSTKSE